MAALQKFRSALNGFNRKDVVDYIEYLNNKHASQINQLNTELQETRAGMQAFWKAPVRDDMMATELAALREKCARLERELAERQAQPVETAAAGDELEAYRRAERTERLAHERAEQMMAQATGILADTTAKVDEAASRIGGVTEQVVAQLETLQAAVGAGKLAIQDAAAALYAMQPVQEEQ